MTSFSITRQNRKKNQGKIQCKILNTNQNIMGNGAFAPNFPQYFLIHTLCYKVLSWSKGLNIVIPYPILLQNSDWFSIEKLHYYV